MKILKIKSGWLPESGLRMDASYHLGDGPISKVKLKKSPFKMTTLEAASDDIFKGNIFKRCYVNSPEKGFPFLSPSDMMKADINSGKYVSKKYTDTANLLLKKGWILVSRSGTLGNVVYTNDEFEGMLGSDDLIRILPNNKNVLGGYLYAYLASKYGYALLTQSSYGGVVKHIEPHHIKDLLIPILPAEKQKEIHDLINEASVLRVEANKYLREAIEVFNEYSNLIGDKTFKVKNTNFSDSWLCRNNRPEISKYFQIIEEKGFKTLEWFSNNIFAPPMFKHIYLSNDNGYPFYNGAEISQSRRQVYRFLSLKGVKDINDYIVTKDTLLIYRHGPRNGMLGDVFVVDDFLDNSCLSDLVIRVVAKNVKYSYWLFTFFSSKIGREILHNIASGSAILFLSPNRLKMIKIPYTGENAIENNARLISKYISYMYKANIKENQAIDLIEKEIESWQE